jgi:hypothetical protein
MTRAMGRSRVSGPLVLLLVASIGVVLPVRVANACSCAEPDLPAWLADADGAFVGTYVDRSGIGAGLVAFTFDVERVVKGTFGPKAIVRASGSGASCGLEFYGDRRTGLLLRQGQDGVWESDLCSMVQPSVLLADDPGHPPDPEVAPVSAGFSTTSKTAAIGAIVVLSLLAAAFASVSLRRHRSGPRGSEVA